MPSSKTKRQARTELYAAFKTHYDASGLSPLLPIAWNNVPFKQTGVEYIRVTFAHASGTIAALGNEKYRRIGILTINVWTPEGDDGDERNDEIAEVVMDFLETFDLAGWRIRDPGPVDTGVADAYNQSAAIATLEYDTLRT